MLDGFWKNISDDVQEADEKGKQTDSIISDFIEKHPDDWEVRANEMARLSYELIETGRLMVAEGLLEGDAGLVSDGRAVMQEAAAGLEMESFQELIGLAEEDPQTRAVIYCYSITEMKSMLGGSDEAVKFMASKIVQREQELDGAEAEAATEALLEADYLELSRVLGKAQKVPA